jgi:hypothetical protein
MHARHYMLFALALFGLTACTSIPADTGRAGRVTIINGDFPVLTSGMTTAEVRQRLGEPAEIQPMTSPAEASAEVWVYYLEKSLGRSTVVTGLTGGLSNGSLAGDYHRSGLAPDYIMAERKLLVTLRLLMVNGQISAHTIKSEERMEF